jgi:thiol-disulfide isomerase/thioredoxin
LLRKIGLQKIGLLLIAMLWVSAAAAEGFTVVDTKGKKHHLQDYKGKWVLVNFWATWCPPCLEEMPDLQKLHETRKDLVVIGIAMDYKDPNYVISFADDLLVTFPIVLGNQEIAAQFGRINGLPTTYLYSPQGKLAAKNIGALTRQAVERYIEQWHVSAKPPTQK